MSSNQSFTDDLFLRRLQIFRSGLSEEDSNDFTRFNDVSEMIKNLHGQFQIDKRGTISSLLRSLSAFGKRWEPYFEITGIFVNAKPDILALFWGALRLMFKLSHNYVSLFERIVTKFGEISEVVSMSKEYTDVLRRLSGSLECETANIEIALASIYDAAFTFFHECYHLFAPSKKGMSKRITFRFKAAWIPFDARFDRLLERLRLCRKKLNDEVKLLYIKITVDTHEKLLEGFEALDKKISDGDWKTNSEGRGESVMRGRNTLEAFQLLIQWSQSPQYSKVLDRAQSDLYPGTLDWFIEDGNFQRWARKSLHNTYGSLLPFHERVLGVFGAPGYGKTMISVKVIEYLNLRNEQDCSAQPRTSAICYYHYSRLMSDVNEPHHALRAILAQVLSYLQDDEHVLDAASLLIRRNRRGELVGSERDVECLLHFALSHVETCAIVLDGLDECSDYALFLDKLHGVCDQTATKLLIIGRPDLRVPKQYRDSIYIKLHKTANSNDIRQYVQSRVHDLGDSKYIPAPMTPEKLVDTVVDRSASVFLWAKLMMFYLQSPALSTRARMDAMTNMVALSGLDAMYSRIIWVVDGRMRQEREFVLKVFQWLTVAVRPLTIPELQATSAIRFFETTSPELDYIQDFGSTLVHLSGALVEVDSGGAANFVHLSVVEFLCRSRRPHDTSIPIDFQIEVWWAHLSLASHCLSYLTYDIPDAPLSGHFDTVADKKVIRSTYPLLEYASTTCISHAEQGLSMYIERREGLQSEIIVDFSRLLSSFLSRRDCIRAWIEASYTFLHSPDLQKLSRILRSIPTMGTRFSFGRDYSRIPESVLSDLEILSESLSKIKEEWSYVLQNEPNEIWDWNIGAFTVAMFSQPKTIKLIKTALGPESGNENSKHTRMESSTLLSSFTSDGQLVATLSILPPRAFNDPSQGFYAAARAGLFHKDSSLINSFIELSSRGWRVEYNLQRTYPSTQVIQDNRWPIPESDVKFAIYESIENGRAGDLDISASLSPDLRMFSVFHTIFRARVDSLAPNGYQPMFQSLKDHCWNSANETTPKMKRRSLYNSLRWEESIFSENNRYLAVIRADAVSFYEDASFDGTHPRFSLNLSCNTPARCTCKLHPRLPMAAISYSSEVTHVVCFGMMPAVHEVCARSITRAAHGLHPRAIPLALSNLNFSQDGSCLLGFLNSARFGLRKMEYDICTLFDTDDDLSKVPVHTSSEIENLWLQLKGSSLTKTHSALRRNHQAEGLLSPDQVTLYEKDGNFHATVLRYYERYGVLVLEDTDSLGNYRFCKALRLPESIKNQHYKANMLIPHAQHEPFKIFLMKYGQRIYDFRSESRVPPSVPFVVERTSSSMRQYSSQDPVAWKPVNDGSLLSEKEPAEMPGTEVLSAEQGHGIPLCHLTEHLDSRNREMGEPVTLDAHIGDYLTPWVCWVSDPHNCHFEHSAYYNDPVGFDWYHLDKTTSNSDAEPDGLPDTDANKIDGAYDRRTNTTTNSLCGWTDTMTASLYGWTDPVYDRLRRRWKADFRSLEEELKFVFALMKVETSLISPRVEWCSWLIYLLVTGRKQDAIALIS